MALNNCEWSNTLTQRVEEINLSCFSCTAAKKGLPERIPDKALNEKILCFLASNRSCSLIEVRNLCIKHYCRKFLWLSRYFRLLTSIEISRHWTFLRMQKIPKVFAWFFNLRNPLVLQYLILALQERYHYQITQNVWNRIYVFVTLRRFKIT